MLLYPISMIPLMPFQLGVLLEHQAYVANANYVILIPT